MKTSTIFFGASDYVLPVIQYLHTEFDLKLVVTTEKVGGVIPTYCIRNNIPFLSTITLKNDEVQDKLASFSAPFAILADFGLLVPQQVIDIFSKGIINIHPSLLPLYRGPTPGMTAILHGDSITGISIMLLDKDLDHGPLIGQIETKIKSDDTSATLYPRLFVEGTALLKKILPEYLEGKIQPQEQDHNNATFTEPHLTKKSGYFEDIKPFDKTTFDRKVKAYFPWPTLWTRVTREGRLKEKIVKFLPGGQIQVEGKKPQYYKDFLNGYPETKEWLEKIIGGN